MNDTTLDLSMMEEAIINRMCTISPDFDRYYNNQEYLLQEQDMTIEPSNKEIIMNGFSIYILDNLKDIGIELHNNEEEILTNIYNINLLLNLVEFVQPDTLYQNFLLFPDIYVQTKEELDNGLISESEFLIQMYLKYIIRINKPPELMEVYTLIEDSITNNDKFLTYCSQLFILSQNNQDKYEINNIIRNNFKQLTDDIIHKNIILTRNVISFLEQFFSILEIPSEIKYDILVNIEVQLSRLFQSILSNRFIGLQYELIENDYNFNKVREELVIDFLKNNEFFLYYYLDKNILNELTIIKLIIILSIIKINKELQMFPQELLINEDMEIPIIQYLSNENINFNYETFNMQPILMKLYSLLKEGD